MNINRKNYEAYFLDYIEGNLSATLKKELTIFLQQNPDLENELNDFQEYKLQAEEITFEPKAQLLKSVPVSQEIPTFDKLCIARLEGDMSEEEKLLFDKRISNNEEEEKEFEKYRKTVLIPDFNQQFERKDKLSRKKIWKKNRLVLFYTSLSTAAAILIFVLVINNLPKTSFTVSENTDSLRREEIKKFTVSPEEQIADNEAKTDTTPKLLAYQTDDNIENKDEKKKAKSNKGKSKKSNSKVLGSAVTVGVIFPTNPVMSKKKDTKITSDKKEISKKNNNITKKKKKLSQKLITAKMDTLQARTNLLLAELSVEPEAPETQAEYKTVRNAVTEKVKKAVPRKKDGKVNLWAVANKGVQGIASVTGQDINLSFNYDDEGKLNTLSLNSRNINLKRGNKKDEK